MSGKMTEQIAYWLAQQCKDQGLHVLFDHGSEQGGSQADIPASGNAQLGRITSWYGEQKTNLSRLALVDIAIIDPVSNRAFLLIEIEETTDRPKTILGDIVSILLGDQITFRQAHGLYIGEWTTLAVFARSEQPDHQQRCDYLAGQIEKLLPGLRTGNAQISALHVSIFVDEYDLKEQLSSLIRPLLNEKEHKL